MTTLLAPTLGTSSSSETVTFDGAEDIALLVREAPDAACLVLEVGLPSLLNVAHVAQVPHQDTAACCAHHQAVTTH